MVIDDPNEDIFILRIDDVNVCCMYEGFILNLFFLWPIWTLIFFLIQELKNQRYKQQDWVHLTLV